MTLSTWQHLGFRHTLTHELVEWGIALTELVHMTNTVQMVKMVGPVPEWKAFRIQHEGFIQRLYYVDAPSNAQANSKKRKETETNDTLTNHKVGSFSTSYFQDLCR